MYFQNLFNLGDWDDDAQYLVWDDIPFAFITARKAFFGAQQQITITDKYKRKKTVVWGKPCIFLDNKFPRWPAGEEDWYEENTCIVYIEQHLKKINLL